LLHSKPLGRESTRATVLSRRELTPNVSGFRLAARLGSPFTWVPGQYLLLSTDDAPELEIPFSIASAPDAARPGEFELAISNVGSRELVAKLAPGTELSVSSPRGAFGFRPATGATLLVGIGTGLAPLRAVLQAESDLLYRDELESLARLHARFRFEPTLSRAEAAFAGRRGRVQDHLRELVAPLRDVHAYVCGTKPMVEDTVQRLTRELGVDPTGVWSEAF
jgi:NAD(P)H-flavin reductase